jgi:hypothetical protein
MSPIEEWRVQPIARIVGSQDLNLRVPAVSAGQNFDSGWAEYDDLESAFGVGVRSWRWLAFEVMRQVISVSKRSLTYCWHGFPYPSAYAAAWLRLCACQCGA